MVSKLLHDKLENKEQDFVSVDEKEQTKHNKELHGNYYTQQKTQYQSRCLTEEEMTTEELVIYYHRKKSYLVAFVCTFFFGPLGLFYANKWIPFNIIWNMIGFVILLSSPISFFSAAIRLDIESLLFNSFIPFCFYGASIFLALIEVNEKNVSIQIELKKRRNQQ